MIGEPQELRFSREKLIQAEAGQTVSKTLAFEGNGGRYALTFEAGKRVRVNAEPGATVTALLPFEGHVDVFATSRDDGTVWSTFFEAGRNWQNWVCPTFYTRGGPVIRGPCSINSAMSRERYRIA